MSDQKHPWPIQATKGWGPVALGMSREQAIAALKVAGAKIEPDEDDIDPKYLGVEEPWGELHFEGSRAELSQILVLDDQFAIGDEQFSEPRLDEVLTAIGARSFNDTKWTHPTLKQPLPDDSDKEFLRIGTLWLVSRGIGLEMYRGKVEAIYIRRSHDAPAESLGSLTPQQLELSTTPELFADDAAKPLPRVADSASVSWAKRLAGVALMAALGIQAYRGYQAEMVWSGAKPIEGVVVKTMPEGDLFPDIYVAEYAPTKDRSYQTEISFQYAGGRFEPGQKIDLIYLPHAPEMATTVSGSHMTGFVDYVPGLLGILAAYSIILLLIPQVFR